MFCNGKLLIGYRLLTDLAKPPVRATRESAGWDIHTAQGALIWPGQIKVLDTGMQFFMEPGEWFYCVQRSSMFRRGLIVNTSPCDSDFRWSSDMQPLTWKLVVRNVGLLPRRIRAGDRVMQLIVPWMPAGHWALVPAQSIYPLDVVENGAFWRAGRSGGIGSTGR